MAFDARRENREVRLRVVDEPAFVQRVGERERIGVRLGRDQVRARFGIVLALELEAVARQQFAARRLGDVRLEFDEDLVDGDERLAERMVGRLVDLRPRWRPGSSSINARTRSACAA
jgi:hypothetical protein